MPGTLTVKGVDKDVIFEAQALYQDNQVRLSGVTTVTFADFGMQNPHSVVLETENDISVRLELVLER
ncbi:YceI-like domain protein [compost metagenome]